MKLSPRECKTVTLSVPTSRKIVIVRYTTSNFARSNLPEEFGFLIVTMPENSRHGLI